jgi:DNA invertase Pin-like site-specific DNA recombinase
MSAKPLVPAALYLRMSTEHQKYSLENQSTATQRYAETRGFQIVTTYSDPAKSGLVLRRRFGLQQLLRDVVGTPPYRAILVYDVSRWGRFLDADESAHYEFLCKSAGVPVHYCAESFANDGTLSSLLMKTLKRGMAAEYSRELSVKVLAGQKRIACLGFKQGGVPGYGLRRMLVASDGTPKQLLANGERKSIATDRVTLVHGPDFEVAHVREMYRMLISDRLSVPDIARELNKKGVKQAGKGTVANPWNYATVYHVLTNPKYAGIHVFGRSTQKLCTPSVRLPKAEWIITPEAFEPIVDQQTFDRAQHVLHSRTVNKSNQELLTDLRSLVAAEGQLTARLIDSSWEMASCSTYRWRFGSLQEAYKLIEYGGPESFKKFEARRRNQALRDELIEKVVALFPRDIAIIRYGRKWRPRLRVKRGPLISVVVARPVRMAGGTLCWLADPPRHERRLITLLARLKPSEPDFHDFHVLPNIDRRKRFSIKPNDEWLKRGQPLPRLCDLLLVIDQVRRSHKR